MGKIYDVINAAASGGGGGEGVGIPEAPADGKLYGRQDSAWAEVPVGSGPGGTAIIRVLSGQSLDPLTAADGRYFLEVGATLLNGPNSADVDSMFNAFVDVRISGVSVNLIAQCDFNGSQKYGEWELQDNRPTWQSLTWAPTFAAPSTSIPTANRSFVIISTSANTAAMDKSSKLKPDSTE